MKIKLSLFGVHVSYSQSLYFTRKKKTTVHGTTNRTPDGKYVAYIDYDKLERADVEVELYWLQKQYMLGDIHLFQSSEYSFHAVCFDKLQVSHYQSLLADTSCDANFRRIPKLFALRTWVLRFSEKGKKDKPKYLKTLKSEFNVRHQSNGHYLMFKHLYPDVYFGKLKRPDQFNDVQVITYETRI